MDQSLNAKQEMVEYLKQQGIDFDENLFKAELVALAKLHDREKLYVANVII